MVVPPELLDKVLALRVGVDFYPSNLNQAILCDFIQEGHLGRHIRRMREIYGSRLAALQECSRRYLTGLIEISPVQAGLSTVGFLQNGMNSRQAEDLAAEHRIETLGLHRFRVGTTVQVEGILLGFAAFTEDQIRVGASTLAAALDRCSAHRRSAVRQNRYYGA
jgi:GntR family transcriptional regulator / MocR family aminotransferase